MRNNTKVETRRDRKALARDAGIGRLSLSSVLAGALCGFAAFELLAAAAGAIGVAFNGGTDFATMGAFRTVAAVIIAGAVFLGFAFGGYVSGRMSRRSGATHGLAAGIVGAILAAFVVIAVRASGTDNGLARVAGHIQVADTWSQWRFFALGGIVVVAAAMVLGGLVGGVEGERWHAKLFARASDPAYGPEAEERAEVRKRLHEAELARRAAEDHINRLNDLTSGRLADDSSSSSSDDDAVVRTGSINRVNA